MKEQRQTKQHNKRKQTLLLSASNQKGYTSAAQLFKESWERRKKEIKKNLTVPVPSAAEADCAICTTVSPPALASTARDKFICISFESVMPGTSSVSSSSSCRTYFQPFLKKVLTCQEPTLALSLIMQQLAHESSCASVQPSVIEYENTLRSVNSSLTVPE